MPASLRQLDIFPITTRRLEVLRVTDEMRELIVRNASVDDIRKLAVEQGMVPMRDQALRLVADDVTTIAEVMRTIYIL